ncbi:MAG: HD domain-containing protein, partial [Firmicutes bacterium]|nr:HD domain-containing protein [Bacillota bacterium]
DVHQRFQAADHLMYTAQALPTPLLRLAGLLHDVGKPYCAVRYGRQDVRYPDHESVSAALAEDILTRLTFDKKTVKRIKTLIAHHGFVFETATDAQWRRLREELGNDMVESLLMLDDANKMAQTGRMLSARNLRRATWERIKKEPSLQTLAVHGTDVMRWLDLPPGPEVGRLLQKIRHYVEEDPRRNQPDILRQFVQDHLIDDANKSGEFDA